MESEFTIEQASIFAQANQAATEIIQAAIAAFERLAEAMRAALAPMAARMRAFVRRIEREIMRWCQLQWHLPTALPHTRYAMRARKMQRYCQAITA